jgi:8-oxo-dGTP pyrophosphatase MutT (NUDIX family)
VLLIADRSVLLFQGFDPGRPDVEPWWITPGGGIDDGETAVDAAVREALEETGCRLHVEQLGSPVAVRVADFEFEGEQYHQHELFFAVHIERFTPTDHYWEEVERRAMLGHRWWTVDELADTTDRIYPAELADLMRAVLDGDITTPMELSGD